MKTIELTQCLKVVTKDNDNIVYLNKYEGQCLVTTVTHMGDVEVTLMSKSAAIKKFKINKHIGEKL